LYGSEIWSLKVRDKSRIREEDIFLEKQTDMILDHEINHDIPKEIKKSFWKKSTTTKITGYKILVEWTAPDSFTIL
jgi:hypothetical protein